MDLPLIASYSFGLFLLFIVAQKIAKLSKILVFLKKFNKIKF